jgi:hypothetical protein
MVRYRLRHPASDNLNHFNETPATIGYGTVENRKDSRMHAGCSVMLNGESQTVYSLIGICLVASVYRRLPSRHQKNNAKL